MLGGGRVFDRPCGCGAGRCVVWLDAGGRVRTDIECDTCSRTCVLVAHTDGEVALYRRADIDTRIAARREQADRIDALWERPEALAITAPLACELAAIPGVVGRYRLLLARDLIDEPFAQFRQRDGAGCPHRLAREIVEVNADRNPALAPVLAAIAAVRAEWLPEVLAVQRMSILAQTAA